MAVYQDERFKERGDIEFLDAEKVVSVDIYRRI